MGLVKGFSDVLQPFNLATNGGFLINQRGFSATFVPVSVGDIPADCWTIEANTIDYLEAYWDAQGLLRFSGRGKKGQSLLLRNKDTNRFNYTGMGQSHITASAVIESTSNSIPLRMEANPRYYSSTFTNVFGKSPIITNNGIAQAVGVRKTAQYAANTGANILVTLMGDGNFYFMISAFQEIIGAYITPPPLSSISYAEDLARCQRYYQTGVMNVNMKGIQLTATRSLLAFSSSMPTKLAGTPSISLSARYIGIYDGAGNVSDRYGQVGNDLTASAGSDLSSIMFLIDCSEATYGARLATYGANVLCNWVASV